MKVNEIKDELEKVAKFVPELRKDLDIAYSKGPGKKSRIKMLWKEYANKYKEVRDSKAFKNLQ